MTNQMNNGENVLSAVDKLAKLDASLDKFEGGLGLPQECPKGIEVAATKVLCLTPEQVQKLTPEECWEDAVILQQFAFFLQKAANREQSRMNWAKESVDKAIGPHLAQQTAYMYEERRLCAIRNNDAAEKYEQIRVQAKVRLDRVAYLATRADALARTLMVKQQRRTA